MIAAGWLLSALLTAGAPEVLVQAALRTPDGGGLSVGMSFELVIEARHAPGEVALLPATLPLPEALAERPNGRRRHRARAGGAEVDRFEIELVAFEAGELEIPAIPVAVGSTTAHTLPLSVTVASNLAADELMVASTTIAEAAAAALAELERLSAPDPGARPLPVLNTALLYALGGLALAGLFAFAFARWSRRRGSAEATTEAPPPPPRPCDEVALEGLERLAAAGHLERGEFKPYFVALSEILRVYVGARYHFDSVELTLHELTDALRRFDTPGLDEDALLRILQAADLVKFAKFTPERGEAEAAWSQARALVIATRPAPSAEVRS